MTLNSYVYTKKLWFLFLVFVLGQKNDPSRRRRGIQIYQKQKFPTENSYPLIDFGLISVKFIENSYPSIDFSIFPAKISANMALGDG
jgi:hypothetical protein